MTFLTLTGPLAAYKRAHPAVEIELQWSLAEDMARRLRAQDVDLCVASQPIHAEEPTVYGEGGIAIGHATGTPAVYVGGSVGGEAKVSVFSE